MLQPIYIFLIVEPPRPRRTFRRGPNQILGSAMMTMLMIVPVVMLLGIVAAVVSTD